jgi:hypothetical protein
MYCHLRYAGQADDYLEQLCGQILPVAGLCAAVLAAADTEHGLHPAARLKALET